MHVLRVHGLKGPMTLISGCREDQRPALYLSVNSDPAPHRRNTSALRNWTSASATSVRVASFGNLAASCRCAKITEVNHGILWPHGRVPALDYHPSISRTTAAHPDKGAVSELRVRDEEVDVRYHLPSALRLHGGKCSAVAGRGCTLRTPEMSSPHPYMCWRRAVSPALAIVTISRTLKPASQTRTGHLLGRFDLAPFGHAIARPAPGNNGYSSAIRLKLLLLDCLAFSLFGQPGFPLSPLIGLLLGRGGEEATKECKHFTPGMTVSAPARLPQQDLG